MVLDHQAEHASQWSAIHSIAEKIGFSGETLRNWVRQAERDQGLRPGSTTDERDRIKCISSNLTRQSLLVSETEPEGGARFSRRAGTASRPPAGRRSRYDSGTEDAIRLSRVLTDRGTEFCGSESHEYEL
jgi:transposase-like protein